ncbi:unnamed protein product [Caenorhabditis bovis]|uniref:Chorein N-terminal domain-containing protein n=1 Tax=Caenorhabditis bovis TaxID=2654633 RepID=A0A8S1EEA3_9PELO|nr:unnamed protein product [Caenorhabditis bovis]
MAGIIKNQLVKHLSKFTKNLKPEQISLDVLKGNTKLQFIEINEQILTDILELPSWLRIKRAYCTGVTVSVPWTRLKTCPIKIFIDEINVEVELSSSRETRGENPLGNISDNSSYGFIDKIVENMSLYINTVEINFDSDAFGGSFMLQRLSVESRSPGWAQVQDLRQTRITCSLSHRTLMFKQLSWHLLRIEASAKTFKDEKRSKINAPLRLITSNGKIRVALKKNSNDGSVIHARIQTILEDILWVATLQQLRSAISFASYIMTLVRESQKDVIVPVPAGQPHRQGNFETPCAESYSTTFKTFYFDQTSYHLHVKKIDLHLYDDAIASGSYPPDWNIESGAMQVTLHQVSIDAYPKSLATSNRSTWLRYQSPNIFSIWMHGRLDQQFNELMKEATDQTLKTRLNRCWSQLMGFHIVLRMYDLTVQCVSDMDTKKNGLKNLFVSERHTRSFPLDQPIVHFEFATYFHPMTDTLPVPKSATFLQLGPFSLTFDERTLRWCLFVAHCLQSAIEDGHITVSGDANIHSSDIRIDLIMPTIVIPLPNTSSDARLPNRLVISMSTISLSSCSYNAPSQFRNIHNLIGKFDVKEGNTKFQEHLNLIKNPPATSNKLSDGELLYLKTSPIWIETDHGPKTKGLPLIHDIPFSGAVVLTADNISFYVEPTEELNVIIDHFQFLQVTRFFSSLSKFVDLLSMDQKYFSGSKVSTTPVVCFLAAVDRIRVHILLTIGPMPSPYDKCPTVSEINNSFMERMSGVKLLGK